MTHKAFPLAACVLVNIDNASPTGDDDQLLALLEDGYVRGWQHTSYHARMTLAGIVRLLEGNTSMQASVSRSSQC